MALLLGLSAVFLSSYSEGLDSIKTKELLSKASDFRYENRGERERALRELMNVDPKDIGYLVDELGTENVGKRNVLVKVLTHIGKPTLPLLEKALDEGDERTPLVIYLLGSIGDKRAKKKIRRYLDEPDRSIRKAAAYAAGELKDKAAVKRLLDLLKDPWDPIRMSAVQALGKIGDRRSVPYLVGCLNDPIFSVRFSASEALLNFKGKSEKELERFLERDLPIHIRKLAERTLERLQENE